MEEKDGNEACSFYKFWDHLIYKNISIVTVITKNSQLLTKIVIRKKNYIVLNLFLVHRECEKVENSI